METNDFFIERDDDKKSSKKKSGEPKTTMFEKKSNKPYEEPKTTIFSTSKDSQKPSKPSYEFSSPTEIIPPKKENKTNITEPVVKKSNEPSSHRPIFNSGRVRKKSGKGGGFLTGFLVSFSKDANGEFWVLHQGKNSIGSDRSNNIILQENNISDQHAVLNIRRSRKDNRLMFAIVDMCSEVGTLVNGEDIEFTTTELGIGDKILIGGYELLLLSFDKDKQDLTTNSSFEDESKNSSMRWQNMDYAAGDPEIGDDKTRLTP